MYFRHATKNTGGKKKEGGIIVSPSFFGSHPQIVIEHAVCETTVVYFGYNPLYIVSFRFYVYRYNILKGVARGAAKLAGIYIDSLYCYYFVQLVWPIYSQNTKPLEVANLSLSLSLSPAK